MKAAERERIFWVDTVSVVGSALPLILPRAAIIGLFATLMTAVDLSVRAPRLGIEITPFEVAGGVLSLLLVLRTNAGYERWWEARKFWGGIVNQSRNLAIAGLSYGPDDPEWRERFVRRAAAFCHASRLSLREERSSPELVALLGPAEASDLLAAEHLPSAAARLVGDSLREARDRQELDGFGLLRIDAERATLIDHVGGCERIRKTPLPVAYRIEIRRFLVLFLASLPFALVDRVGWLTPAVVLLIALPLLAIDRIGTELQSPFSTRSLNHLPLDDICATIQGNLLALVGPHPGQGGSPMGRVSGNGALRDADDADRRGSRTEPPRSTATTA